MADKEYDEMKLSGFLAWVHRIVMIITLPFRKFWKIVFTLLVILLVLIIVPLCLKVRFSDILSWYKEKLPFQQIVSLKNKTVDNINDKVQKVGAVVGIKSDTSAKKSDKKYAVWNVKEFNQGKVQNAGTIPPQAGQLVVVKENTVTENIKTEPLTNENTKKGIVPEYHPYVKKSEKEQPSAENAATDSFVKDLSSYYKVVDNQQLEYVKDPKTYSGSATVVGSNSLYVSDMFVYLYGIYSDPQFHDLVQAQDYLVELTENKNVECYVIAYTTQTQTATALCFADNVFLNKALVDKYLADNIALK